MLPRKSSGENRSLSQIWRISLGGILCSLMSRLQKCAYQINMAKNKIMLSEDRTSKIKAGCFLTVIAVYNYFKTTSQNGFCQKCTSIFVGFLRFLSSANSYKSQIFAAMSLSTYQITLILHSDHFSLQPSVMHKTTVHSRLCEERIQYSQIYTSSKVINCWLSHTFFLTTMTFSAGMYKNGNKNRQLKLPVPSSDL